MSISISERDRLLMRSQKESATNDGNVSGLELTLVRSIGFNNTIGTNGTRQEVLLFCGPTLLAGTERAPHATEKAVVEYIEYCEHQASVAREYLEQGRNNKTHEWPF